MTFKGLSGQTIALDQQWKPKAGGEGTVYRTSDGKMLKTYHKDVLSARGFVLEQKIRYMQAHPPDRSVLPYLAWPIDVVSENGRFVGFLMNPLSNYKEVGSFYNYVQKHPKKQDLMLQVALNICILTDAIHRAGYIIGDFNPRNIGYRESGRETGQVCLYDNDSFQFQANGKMFKCEVQCEEYVSPEIMEEIEYVKRMHVASGKDPKTVTVHMTDLKRGYTQESDRYALAVHLFRLLFNAYHPYDSKNITGNSMFKNYVKNPSVAPVPPLNECIRDYSYMFDGKHQPYGKHVPNPSSFPPYIMDLFMRAFTRPTPTGLHRPTAAEWEDALDRYSNEVIRCTKYPQEHMYWDKSPYCPYCDKIGVYTANPNKKKQGSRTQGVVQPGGGSQGGGTQGGGSQGGGTQGGGTQGGGTQGGGTQGGGSQNSVTALLSALRSKLRFPKGFSSISKAAFITFCIAACIAVVNYEFSESVSHSLLNALLSGALFVILPMIICMILVRHELWVVSIAISVIGLVIYAYDMIIVGECDTPTMFCTVACILGIIYSISSGAKI